MLESEFQKFIVGFGLDYDGLGRIYQKYTN
jgi:hypoxanthine-guanine phosphoribosyltransferase